MILGGLRNLKNSKRWCWEFKGTLSQKMTPNHLSRDTIFYKKVLPKLSPFFNKIEIEFEFIKKKGSTSAALFCKKSCLY